jgi:hypothetical protein
VDKKVFLGRVDRRYGLFCCFCPFLQEPMFFNFKRLFLPSPGLHKVSRIHAGWKPPGSEGILEYRLFVHNHYYYFN